MTDTISVQAIRKLMARDKDKPEHIAVYQQILDEIEATRPRSKTIPAETLHSPTLK